MISSYLSEHIVRDVFQVPAAYSSTTVLLGVYAYSIQIYCDFSGYSDMAIGIAQLLGFRLPENFRMPYGKLQCPGVLAPLAYIVFHMAPRLPLHTLGRQQKGTIAQVREPDGDNGHRRPVARPPQPFSALGGAARNCPGTHSCGKRHSSNLVWRQNGYKKRRRPAGVPLGARIQSWGMVFDLQPGFVPVGLFPGRRHRQGYGSFSGNLCFQHERHEL